MRQLAYALPPLPGFDSLRPKTYAAWPVWNDSTTGEVQVAEGHERSGAKLAQGPPIRPPEAHRRASTAARSAASRLAVL